MSVSWMCCIVTSMIHIQLYTYTCKSKINNNDKQTHFFRKINLSHFIRNGCERVVREKWVGDWTDCNILTPNSSVFSSISFSFCWAAQSGALRAHSPLLGVGSLYSILSPTNSNCLSQRVISLFDTHLLPVSAAFAPNSTPPRSRLYLYVFERMHLFLDW